MVPTSSSRSKQWQPFEEGFQHCVGGGIPAPIGSQFIDRQYHLQSACSLPAERCRTFSTVESSRSARNGLYRCRRTFPSVNISSGYPDMVMTATPCFSASAETSSPEPSGRAESAMATSMCDVRRSASACSHRSRTAYAVAPVKRVAEQLPQQRLIFNDQDVEWTCHDHLALGARFAHSAIIEKKELTWDPGG